MNYIWCDDHCAALEKLATEHRHSQAVLGIGIRGFLVDNEIVIEYNGRGRTGTMIRS